MASRPTAELTHLSRAAALLAGPSSLADVAEKVTPSVVNVFSEKKTTLPGRRGPSPFFSDLERRRLPFRVA